jgi:hypothetical protein
MLLMAFVPIHSGASPCSTEPDIAAARLRWSKARRDVATNRDQLCRTYGSQFYEAATARYGTSACKSGAERTRDLAILDSEIEALNDLIATQCGT